MLRKIYNFVFKFIKLLLPVKLSKAIDRYKLNCYERYLFSNNRLSKLRLNILEFYQHVDQCKLTIDIVDAVEFLRNNNIKYFPCVLKNEYSAEMVNLAFDQDAQLYFSMIDGKRMYFKREWNKNECIAYCYNIQAEQDDKSPHKYLSEYFTVNYNDIVVDAGAAEGIFSLSIIDRASKVYLFEIDSGWVEALKYTFAPWKDKVIIINKYLLDNVSYNSTSIDGYFTGTIKPNFIKIDVEGAEGAILNGASKLLHKNMDLKLAICTYHKQEDESLFSKLLLEKGFDISFSNSFVLYLNDDLRPPYFRKGVLRAAKEV